MLPLFLCFISLLCLAGFNAHADTPAAAKNDDGNLVIYRVGDSARTKGVHYGLMVDGKLVGNLKADSAFKLQLSAGEHTVAATDKKQSQITLTVADNHIIYVTGTITRNRAVDFAITAPSGEELAKIAGL